MRNETESTSLSHAEYLISMSWVTAHLPLLPAYPSLKSEKTHFNILYATMLRTPLIHIKISVFFLLHYTTEDIQGQMCKEFVRKQKNRKRKKGRTVSLNMKNGNGVRLMTSTRAGESRGSIWSCYQGSDILLWYDTVERQANLFIMTHNNNIGNIKYVINYYY